jgi:6,7-dimethyl-8-ribityllumazine synthase
VSTEDAALPQAPDLPGARPHLAVVRAPYYRDVVDGLYAGARRILADAAATHEAIDVAGAFELPQAVRLALRAAAQPDRRPFDGYVALGCVVRGETDHYDFICRETMAGLMQVALAYGIALGVGLLTVHSIDQARARSGPDGHNKGAEAAAAALLQIAAGRRLGAF